MEVKQSIDSCHDSGLRDKFQAALACVHRAYDLFSFEGVAFSFNGGKDSTVLLHILRAAVADRSAGRASSLTESPPARGESPDGDLGGTCTFIFERKEDFPEILDFVRAADEQHNLHVEELEGSFQAGLSTLLARKPIKAVVIGTRRGDPNAGGQDVCCFSTPGWPAFMRVNPILDWSYSDVWSFLRITGVAYCSLYDQGYTSIGSIGDTSANSALRKEDGSFAPAYMLADNRLERAGRVSAGTPKGRDSWSFTRSAAIIIIGDEILSGKVADENAGYLAQELFNVGWRLSKIVTVADEVGVISKEVQSASESHDIVITSGGVGPTLDDVTMAGVAQGLGYSLVVNDSLATRLRTYFGEDITAAHLKMAEAPAEDVQLLEVTKDDGQASPFPVVQCRNVFVLPGVPHLLHRKWKVVKDRLQQEQLLPNFHSIALRLSLKDETAIADTLEKLDREMGATTSVKSYPLESQADGAGIVISLEGKNEQILAEAHEILSEQLPPGCIVGTEHDPASFSKALH